MAGEGHDQNEQHQRDLDKARGISPGTRWRIDWGTAQGPASEADKRSGAAGAGSGSSDTFAATQQGLLLGGCLTAAVWAGGVVPSPTALVTASAAAAAATLCWAVRASRTPPTQPPGAATASPSAVPTTGTAGTTRGGSPY